MVGRKPLRGFAVVVVIVAILLIAALAYAVLSAMPGNVMAHPEYAVGHVLTVVFSAIVHTIILGSLVFALLVLVRVAFSGDFEDRHERLYRIMALACGALVAFGSKATGVSIPDLLNQAVPLPLAIRLGLVDTIIPATLGLGFGWYVTKAMRRDTQSATRVIIFFGSMIVSAFTDVYATAVGTSGFGLTSSLVPNVAFLAALGIYTFTSAGRDSMPSELR